MLREVMNTVSKKCRLGESIRRVASVSMDYGHPIIAQVVFDETRNSKGIGMLRFRLKELIADKELRESRRVTLDEIQVDTGIHRTTLSKIANQ